MRRRIQSRESKDKREPIGSRNQRQSRELNELILGAFYLVIFPIVFGFTFFFSFKLF